MIRFNFGSYIDFHGQRHPLDLEIPSLYYVPESTMNILSTAHLKRYNMFHNSQCSPDVMIIPSLTSQVFVVWGNWYQGYGRDGCPTTYLNLGGGGGEVTTCVTNKPCR